jgi:hypothetical protein
VTTLVQDRRSASGVALTAPDALFRYDPPVSPETLARWQARLDEESRVAERKGRLLIRWEAGEAWEPIQRFFLWQAVDPRHVEIEPWIRKALNGPHPRSTGHWCASGVDPRTGARYCDCLLKRNRWVGGATRLIDRATWEIHRETGLYATRWWVIQGDSGGHRYRWGQDEPQVTIAQVKKLPTRPPYAGDLPYAPFDERVVQQIRKERRAAFLLQQLEDAHSRADALTAEETQAAQSAAKAVWDWADEEATRLWEEEGANRLPHYFAETYGRVRPGTKTAITQERIDALEQRFLNPEA